MIFSILCVGVFLRFVLTWYRMQKWLLSGDAAGLTLLHVGPARFDQSYFRENDWVKSKNRATIVRFPKSLAKRFLFGSVGVGECNDGRWVYLISVDGVVMYLMLLGVFSYAYVDNSVNELLYVVMLLAFLVMLELSLFVRSFFFVRKMFSPQ